MLKELGISTTVLKDSLKTHKPLSPCYKKNEMPKGTPEK